MEAYLRDLATSASDRARVRSSAGQWACLWLGGLSRGAAPLTDHEFVTGLRLRLVMPLFAAAAPGAPR
eukprot:9717226-Alexandrium_andersonii.AAC.1